MPYIPPTSFITSETLSVEISETDLSEITGKKGNSFSQKQNSNTTFIYDSVGDSSQQLKPYIYPTSESPHKQQPRGKVFKYC